MRRDAGGLPGVATAALVAVCIVATACGEDPATRSARPAKVPAKSPDERPPPPSAYYGQWTLREGHGPGGEIRLVDGHPISLVVQDHPGRRTAALVGGMSVCNQYGGPADLHDEALVWKDGFGATEVGCPRRAGETEQAYFDALLAVDAIERDGSTLILRGEDVELRFESVEPVAIERIVDRRWRLEALIEGDDETPVVGRPGWLEIHDDGRVSGSSGCHGLYGKWEHHGNEILFWEFGVRDYHCPPRLREQHELIVDALGDGFRAELRGTTLIVRSHADRGLRYELAE